MARAPKTPTPPPSTSKALINWDEQLAADAQLASKMEENSGGGQFFSTKSGILSFNDAVMPNNEMGVVILDSVFENVFYEGRYDADNPAPPTCFAFGRDDTMKPHPVVFEAKQEQHDTCSGCPQNEWASAATGRGKACGNRRRLALLSAGTFTKDGKFEPFGEEEHIQAGTIGYLKLPPTSIKPYAGFVKQVSGVLSRPPYGIYTRIKVVPDPKTQFKVDFQPISKIPDELMPAVYARHQEAQSLIEFPYSLEGSEPETRAAPKGRGAAKAPGGRRKY